MECDKMQSVIANSIIDVTKEVINKNCDNMSQYYAIIGKSGLYEACSLRIQVLSDRRRLQTPV